MKKSVAVLLCLSLCMAGTACGTTQKQAGNSSSSQSISASPSPSSESSENTSSSSKIQAEGTPSKEKVEVDENREYLVGDTVKLKLKDKIQYELTINSISYTEKRDEYVPDPGYVVVVNYTYKNVAEDALLIDDMRFQLMKPDESVLYDSYYYPDLKVAESVTKGNSCTAEVAYAMNEKQQQLTLTYRDTVTDEILPFKVHIDLA